MDVIRSLFTLSLCHFSHSTPIVHSIYKKTKNIVHTPSAIKPRQVNDFLSTTGFFFFSLGCSFHFFFARE